MRKSSLSEKSSIAARSVVGLFLNSGKDGELVMAARSFCSRPSWDCVCYANADKGEVSTRTSISVSIALAREGHLLLSRVDILMVG
jgi:hypothetical protein